MPSRGQSASTRSLTPFPTRPGVGPCEQSAVQNTRLGCFRSAGGEKSRYITSTWESVSSPPTGVPDSLTRPCPGSSIVYQIALTARRLQRGCSAEAQHPTLSPGAEGRVRVLVIDAFDPTDGDSQVVERTVAALQAKGHDVELLSLAGEEFAGYMTPDERRAYETDQPLLSEATKASAAAVQRADALLFCYPTVLFGVPPRLKSWLERVMVMGVAFVFDDNQRVRPGLTNIKHLGAITTSPHSLTRTMRARDLGRRTIMRTLRLNCHPRCARTFIKLSSGAPTSDVAYLQKRLIRWG